MSEFLVRGPQHPSRLVFVTIAVITAAVGLVTRDVRAFLLAFLGSVVLICAGYTVVSRWLGWRPLNIDYLSHLFNILSF